jgi:ubiquinone/menaquinone biosynthesis C-methylase UbiE
LAAGLLLLGCAAIVWVPKEWLWLGRSLGIFWLLSAAVPAFEAVYMVWSSRVGKLREREKLLDLVALQGDENVLDVGCGRGLVLNAAARRLAAGKAVGVDIWNEADQSGNHPAATRANATLEGVSERVEIVDGKAQSLPFADGDFDVVLSSLAIHNISSRQERMLAIGEMMRVLKSGGRFAVLDFRYVREYEEQFRHLGADDVWVTRLHWQMFPPVRIVTGRKP